MKYHRSLLVVAIVVFTTASGIHAGGISITPEEKFEMIIEAQNIGLQRFLESIIDESEGYLITGPLEPLTNYGDFYGGIFSSLRVICLDPNSKAKAIDKIRTTNELDVIQIGSGKTVTKNLPGYTGTMLSLLYDDIQVPLQVLTLAELRLVLWFQYVRENGWYQQTVDSRTQFAVALSDYLSAQTDGTEATRLPSASSFGLPGHQDLYPEIIGVTSLPKREYLQAISVCREIGIKIGRGALAFVPSENSVAILKELAPPQLYPATAPALIQTAYRVSDNLHEHKTLTKAIFDSLSSGTYVFAVSAAGKIRLSQIADNGHNEYTYALLLHGERSLTAGTLAIDDNQAPRLSEITIRSNHHFGWALQICEESDLSQTSDQIFLSVGHLLTALDQLGIDYSGVLIRKF